MKRTTQLALGLIGALGLALGAGCGDGGGGDSLVGGGSHVGAGASGGGGQTGGNLNGGVNNGGGVTHGGPSPSGTGTPPGPPAATGAKGYFEMSVYPLLSMSPGNDAMGNPIPSCTTCHATGTLGAPTFLSGADAAGAYATITSAQWLLLINVPANSLLVLHGAHTGPALNAAQTTAVDTWLGQEVQARGINAAPAKTVQGELTKIGNCMSLTDFTTQVTLNGASRAAADIWNSTANVQGNNFDCQNCHNVGDGGFYAYQDAQTMLTETQSSITFIKKYFTGTVDANGNFSGLAASGAIRQKVALTQTCTIVGGCHPKINLNPAPDQSATLAAVDQFVTATLTKYTAGQCP